MRRSIVWAMAAEGGPRLVLYRVRSRSGKPSRSTSPTRGESRRRGDSLASGGRNLGTSL